MNLELERACAACSGTGAVITPEWREWDERRRKAMETPEFPAGPPPTGPEEWGCRECQGEGVVLTEDGKAVASLVRRLTGHRDEREKLRDSYQEEAAQRRAREVAALREGLEMERQAREDLERKIQREKRGW